MNHFIENYTETRSLFPSPIWAEKIEMFNVQLIRVNIFIQNLISNFIHRAQILTISYNVKAETGIILNSSNKKSSHKKIF